MPKVKRNHCVYILIILALLVIPKGTLRAQHFVDTTVEVELACGDGLAEAAGGEICDPGDPLLSIPPDVGTTTCSEYNDIFGNPFASGEMDCQIDCLDFDPHNCFTCGNGHKEEVESCDGSDFGASSCTSFGFASGNLICTPSCNISTANCEAMDSEGGVPGGGGSAGGSSGSNTGFNPGSEEGSDTKVVVRGKAYPNADVHILLDGVTIGIVNADSKADFYFETTDVSAGVASFGFWSEDVNGLKSTLLTLTFRVTSGAVTTIAGVYIAPSIDTDKKSVRQGEDILIFGQTVPGTTVNIHINSEEEHIVSASSTDEGAWDFTFNTEPLEEDFHTAKAYFEIEVDGNTIQSGFSKSVSFAVSQLGGEAVCPEADLNQDGRVNLTDFSILLYYWGTDNPCADQNQNGSVELIDFSIMMYYWTG
jgi:hypothetical protein